MIVALPYTGQLTQVGEQPIAQDVFGAKQAAQGQAPVTGSGED